jgi:hypothetical protein
MREANERFVMGDPLRMWNGLPGVVGSICGVEEEKKEKKRGGECDVARAYFAAGRK